MAGAFVVVNKKENVTQMVVWYFGGIGSSLKAVCCGQINYFCKVLLAYYRTDKLYIPVVNKGSVL